MAFQLAGCGTSVTPVAPRTAEFIWIMDLQQFLVWMADKCASQIIRLFARSTRRQILGFETHRFSNAKVADLTPIDNVIFVDTYLVGQNGIIKVLEYAL